MSEALTIERFRALAEAYGGRVERWPEPVRAEARAMAAHHGEARDLLATALALDRRLDLWQVSAPTARLAEAVLRAAPMRRAGMARRARLWWALAGIGMALAGAASGSLAAAAVMPSDPPSDNGTVFGDLGGPDE